MELSRDSQLRSLAIADSLRRASAELESMWITAAVDGLPDAIALGEASQELHRALIALAPLLDRLPEPGIPAAPVRY